MDSFPALFLQSVLGKQHVSAFLQKSTYRWRVVYLLQLVSDYVFVRQTEDKREGVIDGHGDISPQLP